MKLKKNFLHVARLFLLMSAPIFISGTPGVAATAFHDIGVVSPASTTAGQVEEVPILVKDYAAMLQDLAFNKDQGSYDADTMSPQILCSRDDQGNRTYQVVEGQGQEPMQGLTSNDSTLYYSWMSWKKHQLQKNKEGAYTLTSTAKAGSSADKPSTDTAAVLLFTSGQVENLKNENQKLGKLAHHPLMNNIFERRLIAAAIMAILAKFGIDRCSKETINSVLTGTVATLVVLSFLPVMSEFVAHVGEGIARNRYAKKGEAEKETVLELIRREKESSQSAKDTDGKMPMTYEYLSCTAQRLAAFATGIRNNFGVFFKTMGVIGGRDNISDEYHILANMSELAGYYPLHRSEELPQIGVLNYYQNQSNPLTRKRLDQNKEGRFLSDGDEEQFQEEQQNLERAMFDRATSLRQIQEFNISKENYEDQINRLQQEIKKLKLEQLIQSSLHAEESPLHRSQQNCFIRAMNAVHGGVTSAVNWIDNKWEALQIKIRNGGYSVEEDLSQSSTPTNQIDGKRDGQQKASSNRQDDDISSQRIPGGSYDDIDIRRGPSQHQKNDGGSGKRFFER